MAQERPGNTEVPRSGASEDAPLVTYEHEATVQHNLRSRRWWVLPMVLLGGAIALSAVWIAFSSLNSPTVGDRLQAAKHARDRGDLPGMELQLEGLVASGLDNASSDELSRYHALSGDWIWLWQRWRGVEAQSNFDRIASNYQQSEDLGLTLDLTRKERWARAAMQSGDMEVVPRLLKDMAAVEDDDAAHARWHRVQRAWLEARMEGDSFEERDLLAELVIYRDDTSTSLDDMAWSMECLARISIEQDRTEEAMRRLHSDLRRLEARATDRGLEPPIGGLLVVLARCERDLGRHEEARRVLAQAMAVCEPTTPARGEALVLSGELLVVEGRYEEAIELFDQSLIDVPAAPSNLPALLHRGMIRSMLGNQTGATMDFSEVIQLLEEGRTHPDVDIRTVEGVLMDRSQSAMLQGRMSESLAFAQQAWSLHEDSDPPGTVANAVALAAGQLAREAAAEWSAEVEHATTRRSDRAGALRARTIRLHQQAAEASRASARWWGALPDEEDRWRAALADIGRHEDAAGRPTEAIAAYVDAVEASTDTDPERVELMYDLAQCLQAEGRFGEAATWYERILDERPGSPAGTRTCVPLARCYESLDRFDEAWAQLKQVVEGQGTLTPNAIDHRRAMLELGGLGFRTQRYEEALYWLDGLLAREPAGSESLEAHLLVSGCARGAATAIERELLDGVPRSRGRCLELETRREALLQRAMEACSYVVGKTMNPSSPAIADAHRRGLVDLGDTAWDLDRWSDSIRAYEQVARDYPSHPTSLHALVQIASAWIELGDTARAEAAHQRALHRLETMPDDSLVAIDSLMDRDVWERWMHVMPVGTGLATGVER